MEFFLAENKAGSIDGEPDGLGKMWIIPMKDKNIHS
jgi:hypothetical protein